MYVSAINIYDKLPIIMLPSLADIMGWLKHMDKPEYDYMYTNFDPPQPRETVTFSWHR